MGVHVWPSELFGSMGLVEPLEFPLGCTGAKRVLPLP